ncbi:MAG: acyloxyacyl hydrolase [Gemmatimonas sp.]|jgi:hypothetical protein
MRRALPTLAALLLLPASASGQWARVRQAPWQWQIAVSDAVSTRTASNNERIDGDFSTVAVQAGKPLFRWRTVTFGWLAEALPVVRWQSGAPPERVRNALADPAEASNPERLARYAVRRGFGVGLAPFGAEASMPVAGRTTLLLNVTAGAAWFNQVVPYGKATQANFTVAPGVGVERSVGSGAALAVGYALHHLSNASMGGANPGMNSHLLFMRWVRRAP